MPVQRGRTKFDLSFFIEFCGRSGSEFCFLGLKARLFLGGDIRLKCGYWDLPSLWCVSVSLKYWDLPLYSLWGVCLSLSLSLSLSTPGSADSAPRLSGVMRYHSL